MVSTSGHWTQSPSKRILRPGPRGRILAVYSTASRLFMKFLLTIGGVVLAGGLAAPRAQTPLALPKQPPTVDQILSLKRAGAPELSPDGSLVAYTVRETNWDDNTYDTQIWLADARNGAVRQLTSSKKSSTAPAWSPNGSRLAFISDRTDKRQLYVIDPSAGEAESLTT